MFNKILIANRGEITCRIIKTARRLGIATVAVYSDADAGAMHVAMADEAYRIGPPPSGESYLQIDRIIDTALKSGAEAIHPGYGFLAENADFAEACLSAGVVFIGPPPEVIRSMGSKIEAKQTIANAGVPLIPGYIENNQDPVSLRYAARRIGYPLLIKASAGGGGKGMRLVQKAEEFQDALSSARREAASAFGDDRVLLEKYLETARHVEVQIFADTRGHAVHLFERDCSIQRRHQKVLEESPAPGLSPELRDKMGKAAVAAAKAIGYSGAGTVEFLLEPGGAFYFMEMNTRLQVEHPITEMITGQDLVEWQFRIAAGAPLPCRQQDLTVNGHAFEARIYAEDPAHDFLPATGMLSHLRFPSDTAHLRVDTGVRQGDKVSIYYDPLIAKVVAWGKTRDKALCRLQKALISTEIAGLTTNLDFLYRIAIHPTYADGRIDTRFIDNHLGELFPDSTPDSAYPLALACLAHLCRRKHEAQKSALRSSDPYSPWHQCDGWRLNAKNQEVLDLIQDSMHRQIPVQKETSRWIFNLPFGEVTVQGTLAKEGELLAEIDGKRFQARALFDEATITIIEAGTSHRFDFRKPDIQEREEEVEGGRLTAPMPGKIVEVLVREGEQVSQGAPLVVLDAMKMETTMNAPCGGVIRRIYFDSGEQVSEGDSLLELESSEET